MSKGNKFKCKSAPNSQFNKVTHVNRTIADLIYGISTSGGHLDIFNEVDLKSEIQQLQIKSTKSEVINSALQDGLSRAITSLARVGKCSAVADALEFCSQYKDADLLQGIEPRVIEWTVEWLSMEGDFKAANNLISIGRAAQKNPLLTGAYKKACDALDGPILDNVDTAIAKHEDPDDDFSDYVGELPSMVKEIFSARKDSGQPTANQPQLAFKHV